MPIHTPSYSAGEIGKTINASLSRLAANVSPTLGQSASPQVKTKSLEEQLHDALSASKVLFSQISMHLDKVWRDKLFLQLDRLLDIQSWDDADNVLDQSSFSTFLRMVLYYKPKVRPALGLSHRGHLLADWTDERISLTLEFLPKDEVRWIIAQVIDGDKETTVGQTQLGRLKVVLAPYNLNNWFGNADQP